MMLPVALLALSFTIATAQPCNKRLKDENRRIRTGVQNGNITRAEAERLKLEEAKLKADVLRYKTNNGNIGPVERQRLAAEEHRLDRNIFRQAHDRQRRH